METYFLHKLISKKQQSLDLCSYNFVTSICRFSPPLLFTCEVLQISGKIIGISIILARYKYLQLQVAHSSATSQTQMKRIDWWIAESYALHVSASVHTLLVHFVQCCKPLANVSITTGAKWLQIQSVLHSPECHFSNTDE